MKFTAFRPISILVKPTVKKAIGDEILTSPGVWAKFEAHDVMRHLYIFDTDTIEDKDLREKAEKKLKNHHDCVDDYDGEMTSGQRCESFFPIDLAGKVQEDLEGKRFTEFLGLMAKKQQGFRMTEDEEKRLDALMLVYPDAEIKVKGSEPKEKAKPKTKSKLVSGPKTSGT